MFIPGVNLKFFSPPSHLENGKPQVGHFSEENFYEEIRGKYEAICVKYVRNMKKEYGNMKKM